MHVCARRYAPFFAALFMAACTYHPDVTFDTSRIEDVSKFHKDKAYCEGLTKRINLTGHARAVSVLSAAAGGLTVAGIASAIYGQVNPQAMPFILGAAFIGATLGSDIVYRKEQRQKTKLLSQCMCERGYRVYSHS